MSKKSNVKAPTPPPQAAKGGFDARSYTKHGVSEEEVKGIKAAFDLFDTDQGGSIDIKGICIVIQNSRPP